MRLGQLARKLSLRPSQLVDFLAERNIPSEEGSNTRLTDEQTQLIVLHYAPESLDQIMKPVVEEVVQQEIEPVQVVEPTVEDQGLTLEESKEESVVAQQQPVMQESEPEVIRVQKIELSGLKVLGKIDLPEPKKKELKPEGESSNDDQQKSGRRVSSKQKQPVRERDQRNWRNPMEVQRQREARELEEKRKAELEREKEKRKDHYQSKVKQIKQTKRVKTAKETVSVKKPVDKRPVPKSLLGKFLRWWTT